MITVEQLCADLGIKIIPCNETLGPMLTKAGQTLRGILEQHGEGHTIIVLRTITESAGNNCALIAPVIWGVSDLVLAHPSWSNHGLAWIEAFDDIDLIALAKTARANRKAVPKREAMAAMLYERLAPIFDAPKPVRARTEPKPPRAITRIPEIERNIALGLQLVELRAKIKSHREFGRARRRLVGIDTQRAGHLMAVARAFGTKPEVYRRLSWKALCDLSSPSFPLAAREALESRIVAGERIRTPEIRTASAALKNRRSPQTAKSGSRRSGRSSFQTVDGVHRGRVTPHQVSDCAVHQPLPLERAHAGEHGRRHFDAEVSPAAVDCGL